VKGTEVAHELAAPGTVCVISGTPGDGIRAKMDGPNGSNDANVGTTFRKLIKRAGLTPWPRLFNALRSSCETDLLESFPISAVVDWLGHSAAIALKHYARIPDHMWDRATGLGAVQKPVQSGAAKTKHETTQPTEPLDISRLRRLLIAPGDSCQDTPMTLRGSEAPDELPTDSSAANRNRDLTTRNPTQHQEAGLLEALVASLTPEQRAALSALLAPPQPTAQPKFSQTPLRPGHAPDQPGPQGEGPSPVP